MDHSYLTYDYKNIDELNLKNEDILDLIKRDKDFCYCSLCDRCYMKKKIKFHWVNKKHQKYEFYNTNS